MNVLDFGADPTATVDSRAKIQSAIDYAFSLCDHEMADGIKDCKEWSSTYKEANIS